MIRDDQAVAARIKGDAIEGDAVDRAAGGTSGFQRAGGARWSRSGCRGGGWRSGWLGPGACRIRDAGAVAEQEQGEDEQNAAHGLEDEERIEIHYDFGLRQRLAPAFAFFEELGLAIAGGFGQGDGAGEIPAYFRRCVGVRGNHEWDAG